MTREEREDAIKFFKEVAEREVNNAKYSKLAIEALAQELKWIPVSERLPEANIYDGHGPVWKHEVLITGYLSFDDKKETFVNMALAEDVRNKCVPNTNVTAWMSLPKPYEAESEG